MFKFNLFGKRYYIIFKILDYNKWWKPYYKRSLLKYDFLGDIFAKEVDYFDWFCIHVTIFH